jgi:hypothetical protein
VFGGRNAAGEALNDAWLFDAASEQWSALRVPNSAVQPVPRAGHTALVLPSSSSTSIALLGAFPCACCMHHAVLTCALPQRWAVLPARPCWMTSGAWTSL